MGSTVWTDSMHTAVKQGLTTEAAIDAAFRRAYLPHFRAGRFDPVSSTEWSSLTLDVIGSPLHRQIQFEAALQSFVLLRNDNNILPLKKGTSVAVLGPLGVSGYSLLDDYFGDQVCFGGGYDCITTISQGIAMANAGGTTTATSGVDINSTNTTGHCCWSLWSMLFVQPDVATCLFQTGIPEALELAAAADVVILALGIDKTIECEGTDRTDTALPGLQEPFALKVLALGKPTILILCNGGALAIDNLMDGPAAIIEAFNPNLAGGEALGATLFGDYNRWGRMVYTMYPHDFINENPMTNYDMSLPPGRTYRYYTGTPLFTFGSGLSYSNMELLCNALPPSPSSDYPFQCVNLNHGPMDGDNVVLVYHAVSDEIRKNASHPIPIKALVAFDRVSVTAGQTGGLQFTIPQTSLAVVDGNGNKVVYAGEHSLIFSQGNGVDQTFTIQVSE